MNLQKFLTNRFNILYMIIVVMLCVLGFRMAVLTIVEGEEYRDIADVKKIKDIPVKAPRGKILDRNGELLADNVTSFTVQMYTDEIDSKNFNEISYILSKLLDENGERPIDDFPIELDTFEYVDEELEKAKNISENQNYTSDENFEAIIYATAEEKAIQAVKDNMKDWLNYSIAIYGETFSPKEIVLNNILRDMDAPIELSNGQYVFTVTANEETTTEEENTEKTENELNENSNPDEVIAEILVKN
ncbi:MAG: hypothetical protein WBJ13_07480, partial [Sedimentibacter sp.]